MRDRHPIVRFIKFVMGTAAFLWIALSCWGAWMVGGAFRTTDLGSEPPSQVFTRIFRMPVPKGVSQMQVEGMASLSGEFWMRFRANNVGAVLGTMQNNAKVPIGAPVDRSDILMLSVPSLHKEILNDSYAMRVRWNRVLTLHHAEYYQFEDARMGAGWVGTVVVDRRQHLFYATGGLL